MNETWIRDLATGIEPVIRKRIADELYPRMEEILKEEISKFALTLVRNVSYSLNGDTMTIVISDRRK